MTESRLSELERTLRLDAEFFRPEYIHSRELLDRLRTEPLHRMVKLSDGNHFTISDEFQDEGIPYYRGQDVTGHFFVEQAQPVCIPERAYRLPHMVRSHLRQGDVLLSIVGTIGELSLVSAPTEATCSCKLAILRPRTVTPGYLAVFLRSRFGQDQIRRLTRGAVQMGLLLEDMDQLKVPRFAGGFEAAVEAAVADAKATLDRSVSLYAEAEQTLLRALGLDTWQPPEPLTYERRASEAFGAGRLDAEHFQPLYGALFDRLRTAGALRLGDVVRERVRRGISPDYTEEGDLVVLNSKHIGKTEVSLDDLRFTRRSLLMGAPGGRSGLVVRGDVLLNSTGRITIGRSQCLLEDLAAVVDNHVAIIRPKKGLDPVYLACFLNSLPGQMQTERGYTGSSGQIELRPEVVEDYLIWDAPAEVQARIRHQIESAYAARKQAHALLERAKRAVEIAIEESEAAALAYLGSAGNSYGRGEPSGGSGAPAATCPEGAPGNAGLSAGVAPRAALPQGTPRHIAQTILAHLTPGQTYSKAELCSALHLTPAEWTWAIRELRESGKVVQSGERRGARYSLTEHFEEGGVA